jgi:hypothetical protein
MIHELQLTCRHRTLLMNLGTFSIRPSIPKGLSKFCISDTMQDSLGHPTVITNEMVATSMNFSENRAMFFLASAVSDFYVPWESVVDYLQAMSSCVYHIRDQSTACSWSIYSRSTSETVRAYQMVTLYNFRLSLSLHINTWFLYFASSIFTTNITV